MGNWLVKTAVLLFTVIVISACSSPKVSENLPVHPKAVETKSACPPEAMKQGDVCYYLEGVSVDESIGWYKEQLVNQGWKAPAIPPDDEPFPYYFTKDDRKILLVFQRHEGGTSLKVSMNIES